jgi:tRNA-2-methylthio-N6-dimethylallyladenosine synthase
MQKYFLITYGCQMNVYDSEALAAVLEEVGYQPAITVNEADLIVFNTCVVRENADLKLYGRVSQLKALKDINPKLGLIVCGCLAQRDGRAFQKRFPYVDIVIGTRDLSDFKNHLQNWLSTRKPVAALDEEIRSFNLPLKRASKFSAWLPVSAGCNCACSYCIVPYVRGKLQSRSLNDIVTEAQKLGEQGYMEITLLGQNVNHYGSDLRPRESFAELLKLLNNLENLHRIRFASPHPQNFPLELLEALNLPKICEHVHLPLQSGDNEILTRMRRGYTREAYLKLVKDLRSNIPELTLTTDIIVGFPGENEIQFQNTLDLMQEVQFNNAFMFAYSPRNLTPACDLPEQVADEAKLDRLYRLIEMQNKITKAKNQALTGKTMEVLVEGLSKKNPEKLTGRTRGNKIVIINSNPEIIGKLVKVKITQAHLWGLEGEEVEEYQHLTR